MGVRAAGQSAAAGSELLQHVLVVLKGPYSRGDGCLHTNGPWAGLCVCPAALGFRPSLHAHYSGVAQPPPPARGQGRRLLTRTTAEPSLCPHLHRSEPGGGGEGACCSGGRYPLHLSRVCLRPCPFPRLKVAAARYTHYYIVVDLEYCIALRYVVCE